MSKEFVDDNKVINGKAIQISKISIQGISNCDYRPWNSLFKADKKQVLLNLEHWINQLHSTESNIEDFMAIYKSEFLKSQNSDLAYKRTLENIMSSFRFLLIDNYSSSKKVLAHRLYKSLKGKAPSKLEVDKFDLRKSSKALLENTAYFSREFSNNWWAIDNIKDIDFGMYGLVRSPTKSAIRNSFYAFIDHCIHNNLPIKSLIKSNVFYCDSSLGKTHKDLSQNTQNNNELKQIKAPLSRQYGVLSHPAIHTSISNGDKVPNPIVRAAWMYKQVLGKTPPEPPNDVPSVDPNVAGLTDIREIVAKHKEDPTCYSCHQKFDGLGFILESYDSLGVYKPHKSSLKLVRKIKPSERKTLAKTVDLSTHVVKRSGLYKKVALSKKETHGEFYGGKLNNLKSFSDYLCGKGYKSFKMNIISRLYEQLLSRSLNAQEHLSISENINDYSDNLKELLQQLILTKTFIGK